jgi:hypothetical protein
MDGQTDLTKLQSSSVDWKNILFVFASLKLWTVWGLVLNTLSVRDTPIEDSEIGVILVEIDRQMDTSDIERRCQLLRLYS